MRSTPYTKIILLQDMEMLDGVIPKHNEVFIAAMAWCERYQLTTSNLPDDILVSKFITQEHLSDEEISKVYNNSYKLFRYLEKLLINSQYGLVTDIRVDTYTDCTVCITIHGYRA